MNRKYNFDWMREYYARSQLNTRTSLKDVSERFGIPYQTVRRVAAKENWVEGVAVCRHAEIIEYFPSVEYQEQYLKLAVPLAHRKYEELRKRNKYMKSISHICYNSGMNHHKWTVENYVTANGIEPVEEFLNTLSSKHKAKVLRTFNCWRNT